MPRAAKPRARASVRCSKSFQVERVFPHATAWLLPKAFFACASPCAMFTSSLLKLSVNATGDPQYILPVQYATSPCSCQHPQGYSQGFPILASFPLRRPPHPRKVGEYAVSGEARHGILTKKRRGEASQRELESPGAIRESPV